MKLFRGRHEGLDLLGGCECTPAAMMALAKWYARRPWLREEEWSRGVRRRWQCGNNDGMMRGDPLLADRGVC